MRGLINASRVIVLSVSFAALSGTVMGQQESTAADNTKQNKAGGMTADNQKNNASDRATTQKIRKALVADKSLSTYAHNVKIITANGTVELKGPVRSNEEKAAVEAKAVEIAGAGSVKSELTVAPHK